MSLSKDTGKNKDTVFYNFDYECTSYTFSENARAGDIVEFGDGSIGICAQDIDVAVENSGPVAYRGTVDERRIEEDQKPTAEQVAKAGRVIKWRKADGTYDGGNG